MAGLQSSVLMAGRHDQEPLFGVKRTIVGVPEVSLFGDGDKICALTSFLKRSWPQRWEHAQTNTSGIRALSSTRSIET